MGRRYSTPPAAGGRPCPEIRSSEFLGRLLGGRLLGGRFLRGRHVFSEIFPPIVVELFFIGRLARGERAGFRLELHLGRHHLVGLYDLYRDSPPVSFALSFGKRTHLQEPRTE
jgi:hypothetical protein